ncbi:unnamed protein product [Larinioides sclopetarius]|uniref:Tetratricopeptide repeat protein 14 n=1 Tax=Larinioides sclopetarius TaxID=280406 RepID=A0AAV1Z8Q8_9ARAC
MCLFKYNNEKINIYIINNASCFLTFWIFRKKGMDQQRWMDILACHGPSLLNTVIGNFSNYDSDDDTDEQMLFQFMRWKHGEIGNPSRIQKANNLLKPDPLVPMPPEMYRKNMNKLKRRQLFFKHLQRRDILYLQVLNSDDIESYKCLVLAKHGDLMQLDDLSLVGKITRKDLPYYVGAQKIGMTYAGYVQRSTGYKEEGYCMKQLQECLGLDTKHFHSFFDEWDEKTYPASESFAELRKKLRPDPSTKRLLKSFEYFRSGNLYKALHYANKAIAFNPDNIQARVTRGTVYANLGKMKKAFIDTEDSLKLDSKHESARKQMSELLVAASKTYLLQKKYFNWHESLVLARKYNPNNREAQELLSKSKYETRASTSFNPAPVTMLIPPSMADVAPIYNRVFPQVDNRRLRKQYKKQLRRKRKHHRRRRAERNKSQQRASSVGHPIPTTTTTTRRQVFLRPSSPVFRRPFPPRSVNPRS